MIYLADMLNEAQKNNCEFCFESSFLNNCKYCVGCDSLSNCILCTFLNYNDDTENYDVDDRGNYYASHYFKNEPTIISYLDDLGNERHSYAYFILENGEKIEAYKILNKIEVHGFFYNGRPSKIRYNFLTFDDKKIVTFEPINFDDGI